MYWLCDLHSAIQDTREGDRRKNSVSLHLEGTHGHLVQFSLPLGKPPQSSPIRSYSASPPSAWTLCQQWDTPDFTGSSGG